jgi:hypothetical protein
MSNANRKRRAKKGRRRQVDRTERVMPPPEAAQHHRPWPMQTLLAAGHPDGIDADEFEAALQIVETFKALVVGLGMVAITPERLMGDIGGTTGGMSDRDAERCACWFEWSLRLPTGLPPRLVGWIEDDLPIGSVDVLRRACRLWDRIRGDRAKPPVAAIDKTPRHMLTLSPLFSVGEQIDARSANRLAGAFLSPAALLPQLAPSLATAAQMRQIAQRPVATRVNDAHPTAVAPPARVRR